MSSALKILLVTNILFSFYIEINCLKDCYDVVKKEFSENGYAIATFRLPSKPDKNFVSVDLSIDPDDFEDMSRPGSIRLYETKSRTIRQILDGDSIMYEIRYPQNVDMIESIFLNGRHYCENDFIKSSFATSKIIMDFNLTLERNPDNLLISKETFYLAKKSRNPELLLSYRPTSTISPLSSRLIVSRISTENQWVNSYKFNNECGKKDLVVVPTIISGREIEPNEFPWLVALFDNKRNYFCGATLVSDQHVISAAHCTTNKTVVNMELGRHVLDKIDEPGVYFIQSKEILNHPEYVPKTGHGDISLIITSKRITFTDKIRPICIWPFRSHDGEIGTVSGWGVDLSGSETNIPMAAEVGIVSNTECLKSHDLFRSITSESTFCAGGKNKGPCSGDSGSGFVVEKEGRWYLKGVISISLSQRISSCDVGKFAVYCDVEKYLPWLKTYLMAK